MCEAGVGKISLHYYYSTEPVHIVFWYDPAETIRYSLYRLVKIFILIDHLLSIVVSLCFQESELKTSTWKSSSDFFHLIINRSEFNCKLEFRWISGCDYFKSSQNKLTFKVWTRFQNFRKIDVLNDSTHTKPL